MLKITDESPGLKCLWRLRPNVFIFILIMTKFDALIIGGGLSGITTAHRLAKRGCSIAIIEVNKEIGLGANYANGAMLVPSQSSPFNSPGVFSAIAKSFFSQNSWLSIRPKALPKLANWGLEFLINSKASNFETNMRCLLNLGIYSMEIFEEYFKNYGNKFDAKKCGTIKIYKDKTSFEKQISYNYLLRELGLEWEILSPEKTISLEPHLEGIFSTLAGGILFPKDAIADSYKYCQILCNDLIKSGHKVNVNCKTTDLITSGDKVIGARTTTGDIKAKNTILAVGPKTSMLAPKVARSILVRPVKGYSLTYDTSKANDLPSYPVIDEGYHVGVVPINGRLRAVGFAEFANYDNNLNPKIVSKLDRFTKSIYPNLTDIIKGSKKTPWTGFRAISADGLPYIGETSRKGLWLNTGHGHLGWTLAAGSAELLADLITGKKTSVESSKFAVHR